MSAFGQSWDLMKSFYLDPNDSDTAKYTKWQFQLPTVSPGGKARPDITDYGQRGSDGEKYYTAYNLASPFFRNKDWGFNSKRDVFGINEFDEGSQEMTEDERIRRIIDTIVHEQGHAAIAPPLNSEAHENWMNDPYEQAKLSDFQPSTNTHEAGAMLIEGIPFDQQADVLRRRGYL
tara:strand:- start:6400 stop:6927 length:528 start_codon:yes stop_codon:yes gene_type:complete